jgi:hypothetical protein
LVSFALVRTAANESPATKPIGTRKKASRNAETSSDGKPGVEANWEIT